jgi:hypothetical protein
MVIDIISLEIQLSQYGQIVFCGENNPTCFVVALIDVTTDINTLLTIIDNYILSDYPNKEVYTLVDNVFKCQYNII